MSNEGRNDEGDDLPTYETECAVGDILVAVQDNINDTEELQFQSGAEIILKQKV